MSDYLKNIIGGFDYWDNQAFISTAIDPDQNRQSLMSNIQDMITTLNCNVREFFLEKVGLGLMSNMNDLIYGDSGNSFKE
ncbi:MAG: hypothetical protein GY749_45255 [Desulfobacteraceae bacterium]|nr:hypothetical protein [Desulfobacteraceae bacterium]